MKRALQTGIKNDANKTNSVFDVIWENDKLRKSIFSDLDDFSEAKEIFEIMIDNQDNKIFGILKLTE